MMNNEFLYSDDETGFEIVISGSTVDEAMIDDLFLLASCEYVDEEKDIREYILKMRVIKNKWQEHSHNKPPLHWQGWRSRR